MGIGNTSVEGDGAAGKVRNLAGSSPQSKSPEQTFADRTVLVIRTSGATSPRRCGAQSMTICTGVMGILPTSEPSS